MFQLCSCVLSYLSFFRLIWLFLIVFLLLLRIQSSVFALDMHEVLVSENEGVYRIDVSGSIDASEEYVRQVLTDYEHVYRLNYSIIESKVFESPVEGNVRVRSRLLYCTSVICVEVERVDDISTLESGDLLAVIVPEKSDFISGRAMWKISAMGDRTWLVYSASIEPSFFILPILGENMVIKNIRNELRSVFFRIEQIARIKEEMGQAEVYTFLPVANYIK